MKKNIEDKGCSNKINSIKDIFMPSDLPDYSDPKLWKTSNYKSTSYHANTRPTIIKKVFRFFMGVIPKK